MIDQGDTLQSYSLAPDNQDNHDGAAEGRARLQAFVQTAILLGLSFYFANLVFSDNLKNYSNQPVWLVLGASAFLLLLGLASGARFLRLRAAHALQAEGHIDKLQVYAHDHDHAHTHGRSPFVAFAVPLILAVPLLLGSLVPSEPLGAAAMGGSPTSRPSTIHRSGPPVPEPQAWNVKEWRIAIEHLVHPQSWFDGQKADIVGFVVRPSDIPKGDFLAARFVMYHCAVDAQGVAMLVNWKDGTKIPEDTWVRVRGTIHLEQINGGPVMRLYATSVDDTIGEPESPYLTPLLRHDQPSW
jgi:uncharacterized repeat protein (TIGR03943 family)